MFRRIFDSNHQLLWHFRRRLKHTLFHCLKIRILQLSTLSVLPFSPRILYVLFISHVYAVHRTHTL